LGEVAHQEILVEGRKVETPTGLRDEFHAVRRWMLAKLFIDPENGLFDGGFTGCHVTPRQSFAVFAFVLGLPPCH